MAYAHSLPNQSRAAWETLEHHLRAVSARAARHASIFGYAETARVAGQLHDIGKASVEFQAYIASPRDTDGAKGPDHSTAGARVAHKRYPNQIGRMLAYVIAGHHAGLADAESLEFRLLEKEIKSFVGWEAHAGALAKDAAALAPTRRFTPNFYRGFSEAFLTRMLFSCLVDADFLETEAFYLRAEGKGPERGGHLELETLRDRLRAHMASHRRDDTQVNLLRSEILDHAIEKSALAPGLFTLTVPTGGGKTLASLSFALEHAVRHDLRRVIYVIPFTSIIEQTADVFRAALNTDEDVLEHHATFDWEAPRKSDDSDDEGHAGLGKLQKAAENWDAPIVVTTAVQFYESLFAARTSRCRKLHNIASSVIVLDEAQTLPVGLLKPCLAAMDELANNYRASVVICTATQPAWRESDGALIAKRDNKNFGLKICPQRELAPAPDALYAQLKRVTVGNRGETSNAEIAARFGAQPQMLCIVNTRAHAHALFDVIRDLDGAVHLSTLMCPRHRRAVLADVRERLINQMPVRLVATSLIEAGVDVDFPEVWRAEAGLDSIAQAAGRCNREGKLEIGRVIVFKAAEAKAPPAFRVFQQAARAVTRKGYDDLLGLDAMRDYFRELYFQKGEEALDATEIENAPRGVLAALKERAGDWSFPFRSIAEGFRLIDDVMEPVIVPYDDEAKQLLIALRSTARPPRALLRKLQQYIVTIPEKARREWLLRGALSAAHPALGESLLSFADDAHYRTETGLDLADTGLRSAESNIC